MNLHTFKDAVKSKRSSLANELDDGDEDDDKVAAPLKRQVEGEEDEGEEKFNDAGEVVEAFNLRDERDGGFFDENMNYVFKKEKGEVDAWMAEMDEVTMEQAIGEAAKAVKKRALERQLDEEQEAKKEFIPSMRLKQELLSFMKPKETVAGTMRRLSGGNNENKSKGTEGIVRRRAPPSTTAEAASNTTCAGSAGILQKQREKLQQQRDARNNSAMINRITELADELLTRGLTGVYTMTYDSLRCSTLMWEYKGMDGQIYGPYTAQQLAGWKAQGFFAGPTAVMVRPIGENHYSDSQVAVPTTGSSSGSINTDPHATAALHAFGKRQAADMDNIYDDDVSDTPTTTPAIVAPVVEWASSDSVNFGEYVNLDQAREQLQQAQQRKQARTTVHHYDPSSSTAGASSTARVVASVLQTEQQHQQRGGANTGEEDEDDEPEAEAEGFTYRKSKSSMKKTKDLPDSDDDE